VRRSRKWQPTTRLEREFCIDNLLVRIHYMYIIVMIKWTGLAPWEFEFPFPGSLNSTFVEPSGYVEQAQRELVTTSGRRALNMNDSGVPVHKQRRVPAAPGLQSRV